MIFAQEQADLNELKLIFFVATTIVIVLVVGGFVFFLWLSRRDRLKRPREIELAQTQSEHEEHTV